jgi:hypothetical protein
VDIFMGAEECVIVHTHLGYVKIEAGKILSSNPKIPRAVAVQVMEANDKGVQSVRHDDYHFLVLGDPTDVLDQWLRPAEVESG